MIDGSVSINAHFFDIPEVLILEEEFGGDSFLVIYFRLLLLCGGEHDDFVPFSPRDLSAILRRSQCVVDAALSALQRLGLVEVCDGGVYMLKRGKLWKT